MTTTTNPFEIETKSAGDGDFTPPPAGPNPAVLIAIVDLGTQEVTFRGERKNPIRKIYVAWELTAEKKAGSDQNVVVARDYGWSFTEKSNLRIMVEKWFAKQMPDKAPDGTPFKFDVSKLLGKACMLNLIHNESASGKTYAKIVDCSGVHKTTTVPPALNKPFLWALTADNLKKPLPEWLPFIYGENVMEVIKRSAEYAQMLGTKDEAADEYQEADDASEIPF